MIFSKSKHVWIIVLSILMTVFACFLVINSVHADTIDSNNKGETSIYMYSDGNIHLGIDSDIHECVDDKGKIIDFDKAVFKPNVEVIGGEIKDNIIITNKDHDNKPVYVDIKLTDTDNDGIYEKIEVTNYYKYKVIYKNDKQILEQTEIIVKNSIDEHAKDYIKVFSNNQYDTYYINKDTITYKYKFTGITPGGNPEKPASMDTQTGDIIYLIFIGLTTIILICLAVITNRKDKKEEKNE